MLITYNDIYVYVTKLTD